jgi:Calpain family cysteine protease
LYYAQSADPNETWVPLMEKAFAKAHGDYGSISGGSVGCVFSTGSWCKLTN